MQRRKFRISYVKKSLARRSLIAAALSGIAILLCFFVLRLSVRAQGEAGLTVAAVAFCSFIISLFSIGYACFSFYEREKNYILSKISLLLSSALALFWIGLMITGGKG